MRLVWRPPPPPPPPPRGHAHRGDLLGRDDGLATARVSRECLGPARRTAIATITVGRLTAAAAISVFACRRRPADSRALHPRLRRSLCATQRSSSRDPVRDTVGTTAGSLGSLRPVPQRQRWARHTLRYGGMRASTCILLAHLTSCACARGVRARVLASLELECARVARVAPTSSVELLEISGSNARRVRARVAADAERPTYRRRRADRRARRQR